MDTEQLSRVLAACDGVLVNPSISAKKLANAREGCGVAPFDLVIGLIDCTVFGSAKHAVVFTQRAVHVCDRWTAKRLGGRVVVDYHDLRVFSVGETEVTLAPGVRVARRGLSRTMLAALAAVHELARPPVAPPVPEPGIEATPEAVALQAAIAATPDDGGPQLVLADLLLSVEDPRGELIVLDHREREAAGGIVDPEALERYLVLAADYGFPRATPEDPALVFHGLGSHPPHHFLHHDGHQYDVRYDDGELAVTVDTNAPIRARLDLERRGSWTHDEGLVILRLLSDAIRAGTSLALLRFPYAKRPLPVYDGGPLRGYRLPKDFLEPRSIRDDRFGLAARDYVRWMKLWHRLARMLKAQAAAG